MILAGAEDDKKMPLLDHLVELRKRLLYSFAGLIIAFGICFFFAQHIFNFLAQPLATILLKEANRHFIYTDLTEVFFFHGVVAIAQTFGQGFVKNDATDGGFDQLATVPRCLVA